MDLCSDFYRNRLLFSCKVYFLSWQSKSLSLSGVRVSSFALSARATGHPQESRATHSVVTTAASIAANVTITIAVDDEYGVATG